MNAPFRFGVNMMIPADRADWVRKCRRAEELGYDVIGVPDHLGLPAPFPSMVLAAASTERIAINTFVLNVPFYNPVLLARDVATVDRLTDGRVELGLGAGYVRAEFDTAGIEFPSAGDRVRAVAHTATTLRTLFADNDFEPRPARPGGPPLLIAGWGDKLLRVAAEHADVIGFTGGQAADSGHVTIGSPEELDKRVAYVRDLLGARRAEVRLNLLLQALVPSEHRDAARERLAANMPSGTEIELEDMPVVLVGTPEQMAAQLRERRDRFGIDYLTVLEDNVEAFAPVIELLR